MLKQVFIMILSQNWEKHQWAPLIELQGLHDPFLVVWYAKTALVVFYGPMNSNPDFQVELVFGLVMYCT